jgi:phosphatidate phosphatase PAH1
MGLLRSLGCLATIAAFVACAASEDTETSQSDVVQQASGACLPTLDCAAPKLPAAPLRGWRHWIETPLITSQGAPSHRGRDLFVNPGAPQTIIAQFAYSTADIDLVDEDVDIYVQRDCSSGWEKLATVPTTRGPDFHPPVEGVDDTGGRVYFEIPADKRLGPGMHRVRLVVAGDGSSTDLFIDVVPPKTPIFISDVDGTLTSSEYVEFLSLMWGDLPETHAGAPEALRALAAKGYRPIYLTARPDWLVQRTRDFLDKHGFPPGIIHTSTSVYGAGFGASAAAFKTDELAMLAAKGLVPQFGFGNHGSDSDAYVSIPQQDHRIFFQIADPFVGRRIESYTELLPDFAALPAVCNK